MLRFVRLCEEPFGRQTLFSRMPGYIIKPHHGEQPIEEHCNCKHISFEAARAETLAAARSLLGAKLWVSRMLNGERLELWDDAGRMLGTIWVAEE
jgi:hypothetical protein